MKTFNCFFTLMALLGITGMQAQASEFGTEEVLLWESGAPGSLGTEEGDNPSMLIYLPLRDIATGAAVVICPGGGYGHLAKDHEGHQVARWLNSFGVAGFVLKYRIAPKYKHPAPLDDAQRALRLVRANAEKWRINPERVGILGFSAGGHLASTAATHFDRGRENADYQIDLQSSRPDFSVLIYPVISFTQDFMHRGSRNNLLGKEPDPEMIQKLSSELQVTADTPPTFLVHTVEDTGVPLENSIAFFQALRKAGVPGELHIFEKGTHGFGLGREERAHTLWPKLCEAWLKDLGMLEKAE